MLKKGIGLFALIFLLCCCVIKCYARDTDFKEIDKVKYGRDTLHMYEHKATGLRVIWIENQDVRKSFTLGVKTPTTDSTGVNHIIEHTVFTGSKSYPLPSLFFDASSAYPNLFMNALTSGDMTIFPFATSYDTCYMKLLDIYLDSIFNPSMLREPSGFYEESFYYNTTTRAFGGVVYNEMKGAYGSVDRIIYRSIREAVYKDTHYANDSGGNPNEIPKLTYDKFIKTYEAYYYPKNMKIVLYGNLPVDKVLSVIDGYLLGKSSRQQEINLLAEPYKKQVYQHLQTLPEGEKSCVVKSFVVPKKLKAKELEALDLWINAYLLNPNASFQKRIQEAGFNNVKIFKDDDLPYPIYSIIIQDVPDNQTGACSDVLTNIIEDTLKNTKESKLIEKDTLRQAKLMLLGEGENPIKSIEIAQSILDGWAHDRELYQYFIKREYLMKADKLEDFSRIFLKEADAYTTILTSAKQIITHPSELSKVNEENWKQITRNMEIWQQENPKVSLVPISLEQLRIKPACETKIRFTKDKAYLTTKVPKGTARSQLYYNTSHIKQEQLPYLFMYAYLLGESAKEIEPFRGQLEARCTAYNNAEGYSPFLKITVLTDEEQINHGEVFYKARENLLVKPEKWYRHKLMKFTADFRESWSANVLNALSNLDMGHERGSKRYLFEQGYPLYRFCEKIKGQGDNSWILEIKKLDGIVYNQKGLVVATAVPSRLANPYEASWKKIIKSQESLAITLPNYELKTAPQKSILANNTQVDYIYLQYTKPGQVLDGADYLTAAYLTKYYLNPLIRIQQGAYGAGCQLNALDTLSIFTYRDPDYKASTAILKAIPDYLKQVSDSDWIRQAKVEAISRVHSQFRLFGSPMEQADSNERNILMGIEKGYIEDLQDDIIHADKESIQKKSAMFKEILEKGAMGIATNKQYDMTSDYKLYHFK